MTFLLPEHVAQHGYTPVRVQYVQHLQKGMRTYAMEGVKTGKGVGAASRQLPNGQSGGELVYQILRLEINREMYLKSGTSKSYLLCLVPLSLPVLC